MDIRAVYHFVLASFCFMGILSGPHRRSRHPACYYPNYPAPFFTVDVSVIFKVSHPLGPVFRLDAAGFCPFVCRVELAIPLQCPQFFESNFSNRPIQGKAVYAETTILGVGSWRPKAIKESIFKGCAIEKCGDFGFAPNRKNIQAGSSETKT